MNSMGNFKRSMLYNLVIKVISDEIMTFWAIKNDDKYKFLMYKGINCVIS